MAESAAAHSPRESPSTADAAVADAAFSRPGGSLTATALLLGRSGAVLAVATGLLGLAGWAFGVVALKSVFVGDATMKPFTASCFVLAGLSLLLSTTPDNAFARARWRVRAAAGAALLVSLTGLVTVAEYVTGVDLPFENLLFRRALVASAIPYPGRMSPATAIGFLLLGTALLLRRRTIRPHTEQLLGLLTLLLGGLACTGYLFGGRALYNVFVFSSMAVHTAVMFAITGASVLLARPAGPITKIIVSDGPGGIAARRLLPVVVLLVPLLGWLYVRSQIAGWFEPGFGAALLAVVNIVLLTAVVWGTAHRLDRLDGQRRSAQTGIRESEERLRALIEASSQIVWTADPTGAAVDDSPSWRAFTGQSAEERGGFGFLDALHPNDRDRALADWRQAIASRKPLRAEYRVRHASGEWRWTATRAVPLLAPDGSIRAWVGMNADITVRKQAEDALRASEQRLRSVVDSVPQLVWTSLPDGACDFFSARWIEYTGMAPPEQFGAGWLQQVHPDDLTRAQAEWQAAVATGSDFRVECRLRRADGVYREFDMRAVPLRDHAGRIERWFGSSTDIEDVRVAERLARETEERLFAVVDNLEEGLVISDLEGRLTHWNRAALRMHGIRRVEEVLVPVEKFLQIYQLSTLDGAILPFDQWPLPRIMRGEVLNNVELRLRRLPGIASESFGMAESGWERIFSYGGRIVRGSAQRSVAFLSITDVTQRRETEQQLRTSEGRFRGIYETAPVSIWQEDWSAVKRSLAALRDGGITDFARYFRDHPEFVTLALADVKIDDVNQHTIDLFRAASKQEMLTSLEAVFAAPPARAAFVAQLTAFASGERSFSSEMSVSTLTGETLHVSKGMAFPDPDSESGQVLVSVVDLTERWNAEAARLESEARFRQLAENVREVFWLTNVAKAQIVYVSPAYETIWGRSCERLYESPGDWLEAIHPQDRPHVEQAMMRQAEGTYDEEYRIVRPDGAIRWIRDRAFPVRDARGDIIRIAGVAQDVTTRRSLEAQLLQTQKMESMGRLAGGVAHDFNNWLTVVSGNVELLRLLLTDRTEELELLKEIADAAERAAGLTRQLLAFSRKEVLEPRVIDLNTVVTDTEKLLRRIIGEDIVLKTVLDTRISRVRVDPGHLVQVLMNLAVNARDAMPRGGTLSISTRDVLLDEAYVAEHAGFVSGRYVLLAISDSGEGMTPEVQARVFEPFFTTKDATHGTGLGLAVVHGIVRQSGGQIQLYSEPGEGTTFKIYMPAIDHAPVAVAAERSDVALRGSETILLVEDQESVRRVATRALTSYGYNVISAANGQDALQRLGDLISSLQLLVTDVVMPLMGGPELATTINRLNPAVRVLFTSGYTDDAVVRHGVLNDEVAFLQKPYVPVTLVRKVREALDRD